MVHLSRRKTEYWIHDASNFKFLAHYPRVEAEKILKTYLKFVFVREPFERLLSAYVDKFYNNDPAFYLVWGPSIVSRYKKGMKPEEMNITFGEFVNFVVRVKDNGMFCNEHWETYDKLCHPSAIHYDFIGRFENLETETCYVLEISGLIKNVSFPKVKLSDTSSKIPFFYSQLPN